MVRTGLLWLFAIACALVAMSTPTYAPIYMREADRPVLAPGANTTTPSDISKKKGGGPDASNPVIIQQGTKRGTVEPGPPNTKAGKKAGAGTSSAISEWTKGGTKPGKKAGSDTSVVIQGGTQPTKGAGPDSSVVIQGGSKAGGR